MNNIDRIESYIKSGINKSKRIGLELEHFVYDDDYRLITYDKMSQCLMEMAELTKGQPYTEEDRVLGFLTKEYSVSLEPGCQLEVSVEPKEDISQIVSIYKEFRTAADKVFGSIGFGLYEQGIFPLIETGEREVESIPLLPKKRYQIMDEYFTHTGIYGKYMMRGTAATQISIDFDSEEDALLKLRVLQKIAPIVALLTENRSSLKKDSRWKKHLTRSQIWRSVDPDRCGYLENSLDETYSIREYAKHIYNNNGIVIEEDGNIIDITGKKIEEYYGEKEITCVDYLLSMYFPVVRIKKYIEYRIADAMSIEDAEKYMHFIQAIVYNDTVLRELDALFGEVTSVKDIYEAEDALFEGGYDACVYGKPVMVWMEQIYEILNRQNAGDMEYLKGLLPVTLLNKIYCRLIRGEEEKHIGESQKIKDYLLQSTAKYHDRVVRTLYIPKLFTPKEIQLINSAIQELYGIFDKVIEHYLADSEYRKLFGFEKELEELIVREPSYGRNIPMARVDLFLDEKTGEYKFCEFNTDGSSAMNEDRELNNAYKLSKAYRDFEDKYPCTSFELFDSWVYEAISIYREYKQDESALPNVCITDFMENATINEFRIFKEAFEKRGCLVSICDIRKLKNESGRCYTEDGMEIDMVYRRAVTSDIMSHMDEVEAFLDAFRNNSFCLIGDFRTQIVHNKILYKILHMEQTAVFLNEKQRQFIKHHVPYTLSLDEALQNEVLLADVLKNKNNWIIKPEDSYGSKGVCAGVEIQDEQEWEKKVKNAVNHKYILQEFCTPYRTDNILFEKDQFLWTDTSNLTGVFVYNGKMKGIYSRISYEQMISTQYNEMALPTVVVG